MSSSPASDHGLLAQMAVEPSTGEEFDAWLQRLLEPVLRLAGAQRGAVRVLSADGTQLRLLGAASMTPVVGRHCGACGAAVEGGHAVWAADFGACASACVSQIGTQLDAPYRQLVAVPLLRRGDVLGVCKLFFTAAQPPAAEVLALLESAGELLGLALHHARLEQEQLRAALLHERQALAAEVHDSLAQSLAFMKMRLPLLEDAVQAGDTERAARYCSELRGVVSQAHAGVRSIVTSLRAPMDPLGLQHALTATAEAFRRDQAALLEFDNRWPGLRLPPEQEEQVLRIVQEALANVARHAAARHARLQLDRPAQDLLEVVVEDDGQGLPPVQAASHAHYGLQIMRERAHRIGASLEIGARAGGGTRVRLAVPLTAATGGAA